MAKEDTLNRIRELGLLAVLRGPSSEETIRTVDALVEGGVTGIEVTFTTPNALDVVAELDGKFEDEILIGMGTLTRPEDVAGAKAAGAKFLVSPMFEPELVQAMTSSGLPVMIGALTPSEVFQAYQAGSDVVKVFPGSLTGPGYIKALHGPFPNIPLVPTGGVDIENIPAWFEAGAFAVGAGSQLCPKDLVKSGQFGEISRIAREFIRVVRKSQPAYS